MEAWSRIRGALGRQQRGFVPAGRRLGAALALLSQTGDGDLAFVYTRRREDLTNHPGQISFPGGRVEPGEQVEAAAVREAAEEVGLDPATVTVLGRLETFYIPPSRFWLATVVARWDRPHPLVAAEAEVAEILHVSYARLVDPRGWRAVPSASAGGWFWAWQLDARHLLWGATAIATAALLDMLDPGWRRGLAVADLAEANQARPWEPAAPPAPAVRVEAEAPGEPGARPAHEQIEPGGAAVAGTLPEADVVTDGLAAASCG
ncbi:MAG: NUDIX hydrolase [Egibacteraceae bacterium]